MTLLLKDCRYDGTKSLNINEFPTSAKVDKARKQEFLDLTAQNNERIGLLQERLYADGREGLVIMLQAMDAAGKDSTIKHVMSGVNPQGVTVTSFKTPTHEELAHDYLWRAERALPRRGYIGIFNRSYYEDVLVVRVRGIWHGYDMPERCLNDSEEEFFAKRFHRIRDYEQHLYENGYRVLKIFLHVGLEEQRKRLLERIDDESKNWKFSAGDLEERKLWPQYMSAFEDAINNTATRHSPWYVIPADQKWYARWLVSEAIVNVLEDINPQFPEMAEEDLGSLAACRAILVGEAPEGQSDAEPAKAEKSGKKKGDKKSKKKDGKKSKKSKRDESVLEEIGAESVEEIAERAEQAVERDAEEATEDLAESADRVVEEIERLSGRESDDVAESSSAEGEAVVIPVVVRD